MSALMLRNGRVLDADGVIHDSVLISDGIITELGQHAEIAAKFGALSSAASPRVVDLAGSFVTAAFVDAHVHLTATGQLVSGVDLRHVRSAADILTAVGCAAQAKDSGILIGHGWDETQFEDPTLPTADELQTAAGREVYLTRIDVHSALVSRSLLKRLNQVERMPGFSDDGRLTRAAHGEARQYVFSALSEVQRNHVQMSALRSCAQAGIVSVHENAGPVVSSLADLRSALDLGERADLPEVIGYWGELHSAERIRDIGAWGAAGDLFIDGSLGSHTAHLCHDYADVSSVGASYISTDELTAHFMQCLEAGVQGGVHAIGDAAIESATNAITAAVERQRRSGAHHYIQRSGQWRIEHLEMPTAEHIRRCADLGVIASVQPQFDALWGGVSGMYEQRLGRARAQTMNPFASLFSAGVHLAFGSDSPVTPANPWRTIQAAINHHQPSQRISVARAFLIHTAAAASAAVPPRGYEPRRRVTAKLKVGEPADLAVWACSDAVSSLGTSTNDGSEMLLAMASAEPLAVATFRAGNLIHDTGLVT